VNEPPVERRRFTRIRFDAGCELHARQERADVQLVDISLHGALIEPLTKLQLSPGEPVELRIYLTCDMLIRMPGTLTHIRARQYGFKAGHMELDSISHLRRLVDLNLGDETLLERELEAMLPPED